MQPIENDALPLFIVMIATSGKASGIEQTLLSLASCHLPDRFNGTFVIENGEKSNLKSNLSSLPNHLNIHYFYQEKGNKSLALNFGISQLDPASDYFIFFTDDDVEFNPDILKVYFSVMEKYETGNYFGGKVFARHETPPPQWLYPILPSSAIGWPNEFTNLEHNFTFIGNNWAAYKSDIITTGGFDPQFGPGTKPRRIGQEFNMQERMFKRGLNPVFIQEAQVWHSIPENKSNLKFALNRQYQYGLKMHFVCGSNARTRAKFILSELKSIVAFLGKGVLTLSFRRLLLCFAHIYVLKGFIYGKNKR